jgi:hypothetical protein
LAPALGERWLYVDRILEFQSTIDRLRTVRLLVYTGLLYQDLEAAGELPAGARLPPVLPRVLYNRAPRWWAATNLAQLIEPDLPAELRRDRPGLRCLLLHERRYRDAELAEQPNIVAAFSPGEQPRTAGHGTGAGQPGGVARGLGAGGVEALFRRLAAPGAAAGGRRDAGLPERPRRLSRRAPGMWLGPGGGAFPRSSAAGTPGSGRSHRLGCLSAGRLAQLDDPRPQDPTHRLGPVRGRVSRHTLVQALEPRYEPGFIADSSATRATPGTHRAIGRAPPCLQRRPWSLQLECNGFFAPVDHAPPPRA